MALNETSLAKVYEAIQRTESLTRVSDCEIPEPNTLSVSILINLFSRKPANQLLAVDMDIALARIWRGKISPVTTLHFRDIGKLNNTSVGIRTMQLVPMSKRMQRCRCRQKQSMTFELRDPQRYRQQRLHLSSHRRWHYKNSQLGPQPIECTTYTKSSIVHTGIR